MEIRFLLNPTHFVPRKSDASRVGHVLCERTRLEGERGKQRPVGTGEFQVNKQLSLNEHVTGWVGSNGLRVHIVPSDDTDLNHIVDFKAGMKVGQKHVKTAEVLF